MYKNYKIDFTVFNLLGEPTESKPQKSDKSDKVKRNWENRFQRWCNRESQDEVTSMGICGFGEMCDYCKDNSYGRPCVRALNEMLRERNLTIDYERADFYSVWFGGYWRINEAKSKIASSETADNSKIEIEQFIKG
jgi:hypothetical protein